MATIFLNLDTGSVNILFSYTAAHAFMHVQRFLFQHTYIQLSI